VTFLQGYKTKQQEENKQKQQKNPKQTNRPMPQRYMQVALNLHLGEKSNTKLFRLL